MTQAGTTGMVMPKISYASIMIVEDHLKKCLAKKANKPFKVSDNKLLPRAQHYLSMEISRRITCQGTLPECRLSLK